MSGYHKAQIDRGIFGEYSKIKEEFDEFTDAVCQKAKLLELIELSDLLGAIRGYLQVQHPGTTLTDLIVMADLTSNAFSDGSRG